MSELKPYTSGYMKPPKEHRFKKGKSGNPRGRPKELVTLGSITLKVLRKKIKIKGSDKKVTLTHAFALRLRDLAVQGYQPAVDLLRELESHASINRRNEAPEDWTERAQRETEEAGFTLENGRFVRIEDPVREEDLSDD